MNHPDWPAFVAAIVAEPDDDTPRLVAADFLEEHGDPDRAAFIRVQIALTRLDASNSGALGEAAALWRKEAVYLGPKSVYPHLWASIECPELVRVVPRTHTSTPLAHLHVEGVERLTWRRGFVERVSCPAVEWLKHGAAVRSRNPVREVRLTRADLAPRDVWYAGFPALRGLRTIELVNDNSLRGDFLEWLRRWLPGTDIQWAMPF